MLRNVFELRIDKGFGIVYYVINKYYATGNNFEFFNWRNVSLQ